MKIVSSVQISKNTKLLNFMKICSVEAELLHVERQTDRQMDGHDEANSRLSQFCKRAKLTLT
jgi:hypothetical protein